VFTVPDGDDEISADEDHDFAALDDFSGQYHRIVRNIVDSLENQKQAFVVTFQLGPLVCDDGGFGGQRV
jgi:hypothetical protein